MLARLKSWWRGADPASIENAPLMRHLAGAGLLTLTRRGGKLSIALTEAGRSWGPDGGDARPDIVAGVELLHWAKLIEGGEEPSIEPGETLGDAPGDRALEQLLATGHMSVDAATGRIDLTPKGWMTAGYELERPRPRLTVVTSTRRPEPATVQRAELTRKSRARADVERMVSPVRQAELAVRWDVTKAAVSKWLLEWEAEGVVKRTPDGRGGFLVQLASPPRLRVVGIDTVADVSTSATPGPSS